nr:hypothetical protein [Mycobacterium sp. UM_NZ2]
MSALTAAGDAAAGTSLLDRWQLLSAGAFLLLAFLVRGSDESAPDGRDPNGPAAGRVAAQTEHNNAMSAVLFAAAATMLAWGLGGGGVGLIVGVVALGFAATSFKKSDVSEDAMGGYDLAEQQWRRDQQQAAQNPIRPPDPYAHLRHLPIDLVPPPAPVVVDVPEPILTPEQAAELYRQERDTGGWKPPAGSALAAVTSADGTIGPAFYAVDRVARDLGWGRVITGEDGERWEPWVRVTAVTATDAADAIITLQVSHAAITEDTIRKQLPALLQALKVRDGQVDRDIDSGTFTLTVTKNQPPTPAPNAGPQIDPNWS